MVNIGRRLVFSLYSLGRRVSSREGDTSSGSSCVLLDVVVLKFVIRPKRDSLYRLSSIIPDDLESDLELTTKPFRGTTPMDRPSKMHFNKNR